MPEVPETQKKSAGGSVDKAEVVTLWFPAERKKNSKKACPR